MLNSRLFHFDQLNTGDRIEVLMKKDSELPDRIGHFKKLQILEDGKVNLEFLVLGEDPGLENENEESTWFISLKCVEQVRKIEIH